LHHRYDRWLTRLGTSVGSSVLNKEQSAPTQHLRPRTQPISCRDTLFMTIVEGTLNCGELQAKICSKLKSSGTEQPGEDRLYSRASGLG
jgi:hypothetical protein